jgi:nickel-dependent lactate racemase
MSGKYALPYGNREVSFEIKGGRVIGVLDVENIPSLRDLDKALRKALANPIGCPPFPELFERGDKVCILVSDISRTPTAKHYLPTLLGELNRAGIDDKNVTVMIATGAHRKHSQDDVKSVVGEEVFGKLEILEHNCHQKENTSHVGTTSRGTEVWLNKKVTAADMVISTGEITFHYFAGYCGGRKSIFPGVAAFESIQTNHRLCMDQAKGGPAGFSGAGIYDKNPVNEDMVEAVGMVKEIFLINVVLNRDKEIARFFAGDVVVAHREGCEFIDQVFRPTIERKADLVVVSVGGWPRDINIIQTHKAMDNASFALKEGGVMILIGECREGFGSEQIRECFNLGSLENLEKSLGEKFTIPCHTVYAALSKSRKFKIIFVSGFSDEDVEGMSMVPSSSVEEALEKAYEFLPTDFTAFVMPNGGVTLPC